MAAGNLHDGVSGRQGVPHAERWTDDRIETLKRLWEQGLTCSQIAAELGGGLTKNGVIGKVTRLNLPRRKGLNDSHLAVKGTRSRSATKPRQPRPTKVVMAPVQVKSKTGTTFHRMLPKVVPDATPDVELAPAPDPTTQVSIIDVRADHCRWPVGDPANIWEFRYCGGDASGDRSYCAFHAKLAYVPATKKQVSQETRDKIRMALALRRRQSGQARAGL